MITFIIGIILGGIITWIVAYIYYKRTFRDQEKLYSKLSSNLRDWILADTRRHLSVTDLNDLLEEKTVDPESDYPFPYKACPKCGSENIYQDTDIEADVDIGDGGDILQTPIYYKALQCDDCGWRVSELDGS